MLVHLTPEERRDMAQRYRRAYPKSDLTFLHETSSQNGQPFRLDDAIVFQRHAHNAVDEGVIGLLLSMNDENDQCHTFAIVIYDDARLGRRQYRLPITDVHHPTS